MTQGFRLFPSFYEAVRPLPDQDRLQLLDAILDFGFELKEPEGLPPLLAGYFALLRPIVENSVRFYSAQSSNGKKGGRPKKEADKNPNETQAKPKQNPNRKKEEEKEREKGKRKGSIFVPPTLKDVEGYCEERRNNVDAKRFFDYFEASNWVDSNGKPVRSWKQKVIAWEGHTHATAAPTKKADGYEYSYDTGGIDTL